MKEYENISNNCKIIWREDFCLTTEKYKQVSGYIFNDQNELLIVKTKGVWTIPGGHPELYEYTIGTLIREIMEEACVSIKDIKYIGAVEVVEFNEIYYQLRYVAKVKKIYRFKKEWETSERKFVKIEELGNYIKWCDGVTFKAQMVTVLKNLKIEDSDENSSISA